MAFAHRALDKMHAHITIYFSFLVQHASLRLIREILYIFGLGKAPTERLRVRLLLLKTFHILLASTLLGYYYAFIRFILPPRRLGHLVTTYFILAPCSLCHLAVLRSPS